MIGTSADSFRGDGQRGHRRHDQDQDALPRGGGITFMFEATMITSMRQVREMMTQSMISEGTDITSKMDAVYKETALPRSHKGLGSSIMLHHECRHMAEHLRNTNKEPTIKRDG